MTGYISFGYRTIQVDLDSALPNCIYWENCPFYFFYFGFPCFWSTGFEVKHNDLGVCCYVFLFISNFVNLYAFALFLLFSFEKKFCPSWWFPQRTKYLLPDSLSWSLSFFLLILVLSLIISCCLFIFGGCASICTRTFWHVVNWWVWDLYNFLWRHS